MPKLTEDILSNFKKEKKLRRETATKERLMQELLDTHITPHMPRTLDQCFALASISSGYNKTFTGGTISFKPIFDTKDTDLALGTAIKVSENLRKHGWNITSEPHAIARQYSKDMGINLQAIREESPISIDITFGGFKETDNCKLVEKEITIASQYIPEHTEVRLSVECNDPTTKPVS